MVSGSLFNDRLSKVTVLPFTSAQTNDPRISPVIVAVPTSPQNGLSVDSLLVCIEPMTFDKVRLNSYLGQLEPILLSQVQNSLRRYLCLEKE
ncbi:MAG: type II toxin-antitoxin system PemK/MazF family toxin [Thermosynechococcaceae cyanobacterium]